MRELTPRQKQILEMIQDFIAEHHGNMITQYQYNQALKAAEGDSDKLDKEFFRYPGPRPQSRETALLMLADGCEARVRAQRPADVDALREVIKDTVEKRVASGQLDHTDLTLQDLDRIINTYTVTLKPLR